MLYWHVFGKIFQHILQYFARFLWILQDFARFLWILQDFADLQCTWNLHIIVASWRVKFQKLWHHSIRTGLWIGSIIPFLRGILVIIFSVVDVDHVFSYMYTYCLLKLQNTNEEINKLKQNNIKWTYLSSCEIKAWKKFGPERDSNPWPLRYWWSALPTELHLYQANLGAGYFVSS